MEEKIYELLVQMDKRLNRMEDKIDRLDKNLKQLQDNTLQAIKEVDDKVDIVALKAEKVQVNDIDLKFILEKVHNLEKELFSLKHKH